jgi:FkbH-like protein
MASGAHREALLAMVKAAAESSNANELLNVAKWSESVPEKTYAEAGFLPKKILVLGGYATQLIAPLLKAALLRHKIRCEVMEGDYGTFEQAAYGGDARLAGFKPDLCFLCVGADHLGSSGLEAELRRWRALWDAARAAFSCDLIQNTFEEPAYRVYGSYELKASESRTRFVRRLNLELAGGAPAFVHFNDIDALAARLGRAQWRDEKLYDSSKMPASFAMLPAYARQTANVAAAVFGRSRKCLVLDLDNTLWGGVVGDDGAAGIEIGSGTAGGEAYARFQAYLRDLKSRGIILAVCSKNDEANAREPFATRKEMALKLEDFSSFVANWEPKPDNIRRIAGELGIGLDSLVFVDDHPAERELVRVTLPEIAVIELPEDPSDFVAALDASGCFETVSITEEDRHRTEQYRANARREELLAKTTDYGSFLASLQMRATIEPFGEANFQRVHQLINKTNQFNLTTRRYGEAELQDAASQPGAVSCAIRLEDKFGDNGLISVFMGFVEGDALNIDTWLMSCRVLKRGVEDMLFQHVLAIAKTRKVRRIRGSYVPTAKNGMVSGLLPDLGFKPEAKLEGGATAWTFDVTDKSACEKAMARPVHIKVSSATRGARR